MKYQLALQFPEKLINFDELIKIEDEFSKILKEDEIDGHDIGSGEVNFFILTNKPDVAFNNLKKYLFEQELLNSVKVAYRAINEESYIVLYPKTLKEFDIK